MNVELDKALRKLPSPAWQTSSRRACSRPRPSSSPRLTCSPRSSPTSSSAARTACSPAGTSRPDSGTPTARSTASTSTSKINRLVFELATARFIAQREDALLIEPGTGKSHLAQAIGRAAIQQGYRPRRTPSSKNSPRRRSPRPARTPRRADPRAPAHHRRPRHAQAAPPAAEDLLELIMRRRAGLDDAHLQPAGRRVGEAARRHRRGHCAARAPASRARAQVRAAQLAHPGADHLGRVDGRRVTGGESVAHPALSHRAAVEPRVHVSSNRSPVAGVGLASEGVRSVPPVTPALHSSRAAERQRPSGRGPRAREHGATTDTDRPHRRRVRQTSLPLHSSGRSTQRPFHRRRRPHRPAQPGRSVSRGYPGRA